MPCSLLNTFTFSSCDMLSLSLLSATSPHYREFVGLRDIDRKCFVRPLPVNATVEMWFLNPPYLAYITGEIRRQ